MFYSEINIIINVIISIIEIEFDERIISPHEIIIRGHRQ